ncbi:hypothetical protein [uncultured Thalassolituus sp.]|uniref:hypothetical protein n=1 Tax=uncultured Thalassolituus sp. TaxID=285273 RepID=UPI00261DDFA0|nr:hypothetical protein [uncultured Thalassolituus sp.]
MNGRGDDYCRSRRIHGTRMPLSERWLCRYAISNALQNRSQNLQFGIGKGTYVVAMFTHYGTRTLECFEAYVGIFFTVITGDRNHCTIGQDGTEVVI